jgi:hypothetical protein
MESIQRVRSAIEDIAEQFGVQDVQNNLRVQRQSQAGTGSGKSASGKGASGEEGTSATQQKH